jgi:VanZ family protein
VAFVVLGLLYFPFKAGFHLAPRPCALAIDVRLALSNTAHIVLFAIFFFVTLAQFHQRRVRELALAAAATLVMGVLVELAQAATGHGNCRLRDLIPDAAGVMIAALVALSWQLRARQPD